MRMLQALAVANNTFDEKIKSIPESIFNEEQCHFQTENSVDKFVKDVDLDIGLNLIMQIRHIPILGQFYLDLNAYSKNPFILESQISEDLFDMEPAELELFIKNFFSEVTEKLLRENVI